MSKFEEYSAKAEASLAAAETAKSDKERAFHRNAHTIWRKLLRGLGEDGERAPVPEPAAKPKPAKAPAKPAAMKTVTLSGR
jgi:hypothetical protein